MRYSDLEQVINDYKVVSDLKKKVQDLRMSWEHYFALDIVADFDGRAIKVKLNASDDYDAAIGSQILELLDRKVNLLDEDLRKRVEE